MIKPKTEIVKTLFFLNQTIQTLIKLQTVFWVEHLDNQWNILWAAFCDLAVFFVSSTIDNFVGTYNFFILFIWNIIFSLLMSSQCMPKLNHLHIFLTQAVKAVVLLDPMSVTVPYQIYLNLSINQSKDKSRASWLGQYMVSNCVRGDPYIKVTDLQPEVEHSTLNQKWHKSCQGCLKLL